MRLLAKIILVVFFFAAIVFTVQAQISFSAGNSFSYLKGSEASSISSDWMLESYDYSAWQRGTSPFWYGDGVGGTQITDMQNSYSTIYFRTAFDASNVSSLSELKFGVNYDDGFVIWINGNEVLSNNAPVKRSYNSFAPDNHESGSFEFTTINVEAGQLVDGENNIAIQVFNYTMESSDFHFDLQMSSKILQTELIDSVGLSFSEKAGFYSSPFTLTITSSDHSAQVVYTIDGSNPQTSATCDTSAGNIASLVIDPADASGRASTPAFLVRASILKEGYKASKPTTHSYIFLDKVYTQKHPGGSWPEGPVNGQVLYYDMSQDVVKDPRYTDHLEEVFTQIPTISITTENENLFDPSSGIYVNAEEHGIDWEKMCSVELINPDNPDGFSVNAGLRIRGGASRLDQFPRHAFRLFFREQYGQAKLEFPLFGDEGVSEFDKIDFRCAQNYSWANPDSKPERATMVREVFSRDTQRDMGQPYTRSRYYHLYLNGMYWGLYQSQERAEARYASDYFGGNKEDYDVIKVEPNLTSWSYKIEVTDGNFDTWSKIYNMSKNGFANNDSYFKLLGLNKNGDPEQGGTVLVDIENLIDYMILIFYTGNFDSPASSFLNYDPNNFFIINNHDDKSKGFQFFSHDAEHSLMSKAVSPGIGIKENRVQPAGMAVNNFYKFHPQWLHHRLMENAEYRSRFTDRVAFHFFDNGALTENNNRDRFNKRISEIDMAVIGESARWSAYGGNQNIKTKDNDWLPELNNVRADFFPYRTPIVLGQMMDAGIWTGIQAPQIYESGLLLEEKIYPLLGAKHIRLSNPNSNGAIYYTLNGKDPRTIGGKVEHTALMNDEDITLHLEGSMMVMARVYMNGNWSPVIKKTFISNTDDLSTFKVTELHYHPKDSINGTDTVSGKSYEFIEFKNTGKAALNLSGVVIDSAIYYMFPENTILSPDEYYVVATKPKYFYERYGMTPSGNCEKFFSNSGEFVWIADRNNEGLLSFTYFDEFPWPESADGDGYSLTSVLNYPIENPDNFQNWRSSEIMHGSPFSNDSVIISTEIVYEDILQNGFKVFPNPTSGYLYIVSDHNNTVGTITLMGINGEVIYQSVLETNNQMNLDDLDISNGVYILHIRTRKGIHTVKIVYTP